MRPRRPFFGLALMAILGIVVADYWRLPLEWLAGIGSVLALVCVLRPRTILCLLLVFAGFAARQTLVRQAPALDTLAYLFVHSPTIDAEGIVISPPEALPYFAGQQSGSFQLALEAVEAKGQRHPISTKLHTVWAGPLPQLGDRVRIHGALRALEPNRNPGPFDFSAAQRRAGIVARLEATLRADCRVLAHGQGNPLLVFAQNARGWLQAQLATDLEDSPELASLIASMVLGLRGETPDDLKELFRKTGTLHLFAVSGLNIAMLGLLASYLLNAFGYGPRVQPLVIIPILLVYAVITGLSASCVRAAIMGSLVLLGTSIDRKADIYNSLAAAAVLILAWDPQQLFLPGFQFSFALVFVIVLLADRIANPITERARPDPYLPQPLWSPRQRFGAWAGRIVAGTLGVTLAAWLGSLFFTAGYFHLFSLASILANLLAVPIAFLILALGVATIACAWCKPVAILFSNANWACSKVLILTVQTFAHLPGGHSYVEHPTWKKAPVCEVTVLDVGAGAAIHVRSAGQNWLIDGGPGWRYSGTTLPYLRSRGVNQLDALVLSHGDSQHIGSATQVFADFAPQLVLDSAVKDRSTTRKRLHTALSDAQRGKAFARRGDVFPLGHATITVLFPPAGWQRSSADDKTLILRLDCAAHRLLFTSDAGFTAERWLLENEPDLRADVLIKGQHAKDFSGTADFLARVQPQAVIVGSQSVQEGPQSLDAWAAEADKVTTIFRQDRCGAVQISINQDALEVHGHLGDHILRKPVE